MYTFNFYNKSRRKYTSFRLADLLQGSDSVDTSTIGKLEGMQDLSFELTKCKDDKLKLQTLIADLTQVNRRWHRYSIDMQIYIKKLQLTIEEQQEQINNTADSKAHQLLHGNSGWERDCAICRQVIQNLRLKISELENQLITQMHQDTQVLSLQLRLSQAYQHINHLNRLMQNKGILKTGLNLPETSHSRQEEMFGQRRMKFYECDVSGSKDSEMTSKGLSQDALKYSHEEAEISGGLLETLLLGETSESTTIPLNINSKDTAVAPNGLHDRIINKVELGSAKDEADSDLINRLSGNYKKIPSTSSVKLPPYETNESINRNLVSNHKIKSPDGCSIKLKAKLLEDEGKSCDGFDVEACETNRTPKLNDMLNNTTSDITPDKINNSCGIFGLLEVGKFSGATLSGCFGDSCSIICPHCLTVFPPDASDCFNQHITSCLTVR